MKVAGFTFIRNALQFDFPVVEAITSVLPLCDAFYVAVGKSDDDTPGLILGIPGDKIRIIETEWNPGITKGGAVYADETNKVFDAIPAGFDWCFYIQGDEVLHEKYLDEVNASMRKWVDIKQIEGLLFYYRHFYGTYDYVGDSRHWYRREVRIIRNDKTIRSYRDAQGFRKNGRKIAVAPVNAEIFHYGWVRHPRNMQQKIDAVRQYYQALSNEQAMEKVQHEEFDYSRNYDALDRFSGTHPRVMESRINRLNWVVKIDTNKRKMNPRYKLLFLFEKLTGIRPFEFRNYRIIKGEK